MERHRRLNPVCAFVLNQNNCDNIPMQTEDEASTADNKNNVTFNSQTTGSDFQPDLKNEQIRLNTFQNWPVSVNIDKI